MTATTNARQRKFLNELADLMQRYNARLSLDFNYSELIDIYFDFGSGKKVQLSANGFSAKDLKEKSANINLAKVYITDKGRLKAFAERTRSKLHYIESKCAGYVLDAGHITPFYEGSMIDKSIDIPDMTDKF